MVKRMAFFLITLILGCSHGETDLLIPSLTESGNKCAIASDRSPHTLWGIYSLLFSEDHLSCDVVPVRTVDFHFNALKFLEVAPCTNCLTVGKPTPLGNGVIDLDVTVRHPFDQPLIYSAFDVKGIIMFDGSLRAVMLGNLYELHPEIHPVWISWALRGDWELLNPDGYSYYWSVPFNADSEWPITKYMPGRLSVGSPTGKINGYKEFYTNEARHLFRPGHSVTQTYRVQTQPGPMAVGYAIDACWQPPLVVPVMDPLTDFPPSANQPEPYCFEVVVNDGQPVDNDDLCGDDTGAIKVYVKQWNGLTVTKVDSLAYYQEPGVLFELIGTQDYLEGANYKDLKKCKYGDCGEGCFCGIEVCFKNWHDDVPEGWYRLVTTTYYVTWTGATSHYYDHAVDVTDFYCDPWPE